MSVGFPGGKSPTRPQIGISVAVGTTITDRPPHRTVRAWRIRGQTQWALQTGSHLRDGDKPSTGLHDGFGNGALRP
jgi:hypothetical protein